ncbi:hypothetical protein [Montanilutibacter psychrotolerans]|uniref:Dicarboxylate transport domain-containing protein n=1 Tax=Montanilutibacter psychrotolerans TaxID=1327343 RepID=A0A3M8SUH9_9GAMM|nr:hypothetical protein [Lysobacter psychrotolerans]RNF84977.1 hypothetical protein EER27_04075 [Lysobacter psychrotolerans]
MTRTMLRLLSTLLLPVLLPLATHAQARVVSARIARVSTAVATLDDVRVRLQWHEGATEGVLRLQAARIDAPDLGYRFGDVDWQCPLRRVGNGGWHCDGAVRGDRGKPLRLSLAIGVADTHARLSRGDAVIGLHRDAATPDLTRIDLRQVPIAWSAALLAKAWPEARLKQGRVDATLAITAATDRPVRVTGPLSVQALGLDTPDGAVAAENVSARLQLDMQLGERTHAALRGHLVGGELLFGNTYVSLQQRSVAVALEAARGGSGGWSLPHFAWRDEEILALSGSAALGADGSLRALELHARSGNLQPLRDGYLSGWLGLAGLGDLELRGRLEADLHLVDGALRSADARLQALGISDPQHRFGFDGLDGDLRFSSTTAVESALQWQGGELYGLAFGAARLPFSSSQGELRLREPVAFPILGGRAGFDHLRIRPPADGHPFEVGFGLALDRLDVGQLAKALEWPAFGGELSGRIPQARYANDRLEFEGGFDMQVFDGRVAVSSLAMERPFGTAPTLSADISLDDLDMEALTGAFDFGSITGRLDGRIDALRLVDWTPVAFDAQLHSQRHDGVRQRISQRAVQDLSSVGDASFANSLQSQLIGLFDDFGYSRLGIACRLADEVCQMDGIGSAGQGFIIVDGSGIPRLRVVGFNRRVDWPTLLERLAAVGSGDVKPVFD